MASSPPDVPAIYHVSPDLAGRRLDRVICEWRPEYSRTFWQRQIHSGRVRLNGQIAKAGTIVQGGDEVVIERVNIPSLRPDRPTRPMDLSWIMYQDDYLIVVNKPRYLVVHPSRGHEDDSVVHRLLPLLPNQGDDFRPGVVHRLDRDTTGLLVLARTDFAKARLSQMIQKREVRRDYIAVIHGHMDPPEGIIDAPIGRHQHNRLKMAVVRNGRDARTRYRTLATWAAGSLLQLTLETGRTHQIRVHLSAMGRYVVGDPLYGGPEAARNGTGQLLHALRLAFRHPITQDPLCFWHYPPLDWRQALLGVGQATITAEDVSRGDSLGCSNILTKTLLRDGLGVLA